MAITSYDELKAAVANWLDRDDLSSRLDEFIALCEADLNRKLRVKEMVSSSTVNTVAGTSTISLPTGFLSFKSSPYLSTNPVVKLDLATEDYLNGTYLADTSGKPLAFDIQGTSIKLYPTPDAVYTVNIKYNKRIASLSSENTSNSILSSYPDIYLYGCLVAAHGYLDNDIRMPQWKSLYDTFIAEANNTDTTLLLSISGGAYSDAVA